MSNIDTLLAAARDAALAAACADVAYYARAKRVP